MSAAFDPRTDPRACVLCKSEDVTEVDRLRPSGVAPMILCPNGHVTNGVPTAAWFRQYKADAEGGAQ